MSDYLYACTNCHSMLAVSVHRKLPEECPTCESVTGARDAVGKKLFKQVST